MTLDEKVFINRYDNKELFSQRELELMNFYGIGRKVAIIDTDEILTETIWQINNRFFSVTYHNVLSTFTQPVEVEPRVKEKTSYYTYWRPIDGD